MILKDVAFEDLQTVVKFMYHGIVNVSSDKLPGVLKVKCGPWKRFYVLSSVDQTYSWKYKLYRTLQLDI